MDISNFISQKFSPDAFLSTVVFIAKKPPDDISKKINQKFPFSSVYINSHPFNKIVVNTNKVVGGGGGPAISIQASQNNSFQNISPLIVRPKKLKHTYSSPPCSSVSYTHLDQTHKLSYYFTKDQLQKIQKDNSQFLTSKKGSQTNQPTLETLPLHHVYNDLVSDSLLPLTRSYKIQNIFRNLGAEGVIEVSYKSAVVSIVEELQVEEQNAREILLRAADLDILVIRNRTITPTHELSFVSLKVYILSLENLIWVVKALKNDRLTPLEAYVKSRVKHSFDLQIKPKNWKKMIQRCIAYLEAPILGKLYLYLYHYISYFYFYFL